MGDPKSEAGRRTLAIPPNLLDGLDHHLKTYAAGGQPGWLFPGEDGPKHPRTFNHAWGKVAKAIGRPEVTVHDLRHSGLTWSAVAGASIAELMKRGGHSSPHAAIRYQHANDDHDAALAAALGKLADLAPVVNIGRPNDGQNFQDEATG